MNWVIDKKKLLIHLFFWIGFLLVHTLSTYFLNDKFELSNVLKFGLLYSASGLIYSFFAYIAVKEAKARIKKHILFIVISILLIYITTYFWNISQHFSFWLISGEGNFSPEHYLYAFKSFKSSIFIIASILAIVLSEKNIKSNSEKKVSQTLDLENIRELVSNKKLSYNEIIFIPNKDKIIDIKLSSIKLIKANDYYSNIILENENKNKTIISKYSLKKWEQVLPNKHFLRIHRSTIVNKDFISSIERMSSDIYNVKISGYEELLSISRRRAKSILDNYQL